MFTRRDFIKTMSLMSGAVLAPVQWLAKWAGMQPARAEETVEGELYAGFVLLPEGAKVPEFVEYPKKGIPIVCGVEGNATTGITKSFDREDDLIKEVRLPMYRLNQLPPGLSSAGGYILSHKTEEIFSVLLSYKIYDMEIQRTKTAITLCAQPDVPRPFPLWSSEPVEPGGSSVILEKVTFLPIPGIMVISQTGYIFYWIDNTILYTLIMDYHPTYEEAQWLVNSLEQVQ
jgi:hypothetical protein